MTPLNATGKTVRRPGSKAGRACHVAESMMRAEPGRRFSTSEIGARAGLDRRDVYTALTADPVAFVRVGIGLFQLRTNRKGKTGMQFVRLNGGDVKAGDVLYSTGAHKCLPAGERLVVQDRHGALYVTCNGGQRGTGAHVLHFLDRDVDDETGELAGFSRHPVKGEAAA